MRKLDADFAHSSHKAPSFYREEGVSRKQEAQMVAFANPALEIEKTCCPSFKEVGATLLKSGPILVSDGVGAIATIDAETQMNH